MEQNKRNAHETGSNQRFKRLIQTINEYGPDILGAAQITALIGFCSWIALEPDSFIARRHALSGQENDNASQINTDKATRAMQRYYESLVARSSMEHHLRMQFDGRVESLSQQEEDCLSYKLALDAIASIGGESIGVMEMREDLRDRVNTCFEMASR